MGIYAAFEISAVARLKHTFAGVKKKLRAFLDETRALFDQSSSWKNYREAFKAVGPPAVPYLFVSILDVFVSFTYVLQGYFTHRLGVYRGWKQNTPGRWKNQLYKAETCG